MVYVVAFMLFVGLFNSLLSVGRVSKQGNTEWRLRFKPQSFLGGLAKVVVLLVSGLVLWMGITAWLRQYWHYVLLAALTPPVVATTYRLIRWLVARTDAAYQADSAFARKVRWGRRYSSIMPDVNND